MFKLMQNVNELKSELEVEKIKKKEWRETNAHTRYSLYKTIGEALAQKFGFEIPYVKLQSNRCLVYTAPNGVDFVIRVTQKRQKLNYKAKSTEVFEQPKDYDEEEWLQEVAAAIAESGD